MEGNLLVLAQHFLHRSYITVMSAEALNCDKLTGQSHNRILGLLEVMRLVWACLSSFFILVKVNTSNKGAKAQAAIRGSYLKQLQSILKTSFNHFSRSERLSLLSVRGGFT